MSIPRSVTIKIKQFYVKLFELIQRNVDKLNNEVLKVINKNLINQYLLAKNNDVNVRYLIYQ